MAVDWEDILDVLQRGIERLMVLLSYKIPILAGGCAVCDEEGGGDVKNPRWGGIWRWWSNCRRGLNARRVKARKVASRCQHWRVTSAASSYGTLQGNVKGAWVNGHVLA